MKPISRVLAAAAVGVIAVAGGTAPAFATSSNAQPAHDWSRGADHVVFVQTDNPNGNAVVAYDRADDGSLTPAGTYPTGGNGGVLTGSVVDHLASQGSLAYDAAHGLLIAVNAGSNTISVFGVHGDRLSLREVLPSGGAFPVSVAVHGDIAYVLNARNGASVQGYRIAFDVLFPIFGSHRALGLDPAATPEFTHTPGQVAFTPDGSRLIVTTKANGSDIDVFRVGLFGWLSAAPVVNSEPGAVPFAVTFDRSGNLVVAEAGTNALETFALHFDGTLTSLHSVATNQAATCWVAGFNGQFYASNAGSATLSRVQSGPGGGLTLLDNTATTAGTVDAAVSTASHTLYVQTGAAGVVDAFHINGDGSLTHIGDVTVPNAAGGEGIVAI
jgi:hypothetical protein